MALLPIMYTFCYAMLLVLSSHLVDEIDVIDSIFLVMLFFFVLMICRLVSASNL